MNVTQQKDQQALMEEILRLKREKNAVILAHNYQIPEIQDLADFVGDSLGLARRAQETDADIIVFCGVVFMAETAKILNPEKKVLIPSLEAGCSLVDSISVEALRAWKAEHPDAVVVGYVNTSAEIKAECDVCVTSSNAVELVQSIPEDKEILFLPDMFLGAYVARKTGRNLHIWPGECHVHARLGFHRIRQMQERYPDAELLVHPECGCSTSCLYYAESGDLGDRVHILSTSGMIRQAKAAHAQRYLVATEVGILHPLRKAAPDREFVPVDEEAVCPYMKKITLENLWRSLREEVYEIDVPEPTRTRALKALQAMVSVG